MSYQFHRKSPALEGDRFWSMCGVELILPVAVRGQTGFVESSANEENSWYRQAHGEEEINWRSEESPEVITFVTESFRAVIKLVTTSR